MFFDDRVSSSDALIYSGFIHRTELRELSGEFGQMHEDVNQRLGRSGWQVRSCFAIGHDDERDYIKMVSEEENFREMDFER